MNPSLSTVDSLLNILPNPLTNTIQRMSGINNIDNVDINKVRSSPSFNDSEPPSYFEAVRISNNNVLLENFPATQQTTTTTVTMRQPNHQLPVSISSKDFSESNNYASGDNRTTHVFRNFNLPSSIYQHEENVIQRCSTNPRQVNIECKPSETYLVWSIFTTIYCVFIGIFALVLSIKVRKLNKVGDYKKANRFSRVVWYLNISGLFFGFVYLGIALLTCLLPRS
jgi:hypothetical protein